MGVRQRGQRPRDAYRVPIQCVLVILALLIAGCGVGHTSSVFEAAAPVSADVAAWYPSGDFNRHMPVGLKGLKGRDGTDAWFANTGEYRTPAQGFPVQVGSVIYTEGSLDQGDPGMLSAVRATDGHILWQVPLPFPSGVYAEDLTMAVDSTTMLVTDGNSGLYALDTTTGKVRWHVDGAGVGTSFHQTAVGGGVVAAFVPGTQDGSARLVAYREDTGKLLWQGPEYSSYIGLTLGVNSHAVYIAPNEAASSPSPNALVAYDARTGHELWRDEVTGGIVEVTDQMVLLGGAYVSSSPSNGTIASFDAVTGALTWQAQGNYNQWYELQVSPTTIYVPTTSNPTGVTAISIATGAQLWRAQFGNYYVGTVQEEQGVAFVLLDSAQNYFSATPPNRLVALNAHTGKVYWERDIPDNF